jgi:putative flippase GtrA
MRAGDETAPVTTPSTAPHSSTALDPSNRRSLTNRVVARVRSLLGKRANQVFRLVRYGTTSLLAFGVSEAVLVGLYGHAVVNATVAAFIANLAGTVPSYLMSRYWIWHDASRARVGRQMALYWSTSAVTIVLTSLGTGAIASLAPAGHRYHLVVAVAGFTAVNLGFWVAKFVLYQRVVFPVSPPAVDAS